MSKLAEIGRRFRSLRAKGVTQEALAAEIGVSRSMIAGVETGGDWPGLQATIAFADHFKVPLDWLLCRKPPAGGPLVGQFVDDGDELAFLNFWRGLTDAERTAALSLLRIDRDRAAE